MNKTILTFLLLVTCLIKPKAQDCIDVDAVACLMECITATYTGSAPPEATYTWSSSCGTFATPNQQDPGLICFPFLGTCTIQLIVEEVGMTPDTCIAEVIVFPNPSGVLEADTTICSGDCATLETTFFTGTPPFAYQVDDGTNTNFYTSPGLVHEVPVCPIFTTTYTLVNITDAFGCTSGGPFNDDIIEVVPGVMGSVTQNGNILCANPPGQNYLWWDCSFTQLLFVSQCYTMPQNGCYCVVIADANSGCLDTVCNDYSIPCVLTCEIIGQDTACFGDQVPFVYSGNASDTATFQWTFTPPAGPASVYNNVDSVSYTLESVGCVAVELIVTDGDCETICYDTICSAEHLFFATLYDDITSCDSCVSIAVGLSGTAPYTIHITDGTTIDTITGIQADQFDYEVCPEANTTTIFTLLYAADSLSQCATIIGDDSVTVSMFSQPTALITQTGNVLCADSVIGAYKWYDCGFATVLSDSICYELTQSGCYCLVVTNGICRDTICGDFIFDPCSLTCAIILDSLACTGDSIHFVYTGNASSGALFNWLIDLPGFPGSNFSGNDTITLAYSQEGCYQASVTVVDGSCISTCEDSICISTPNSEASICCDEVKCDTCTNITVTLSGLAPWTVFIGNGNTVDTISGITTSPYTFQVCPPADSTVTYTLLGVMDTVNACPGYITGINTASITLHDTPAAVVTQEVDTLCASPDGLTYGWYQCPSGVYISNSRCFVPTVSGCYCVDVSTAFDCVDTACYSIILTSITEPTKELLHIYPNIIADASEITLDPGIALPAKWILYDILGRPIFTGELNSHQSMLQWNNSIPGGLYLFVVMDGPQRMYLSRLFRE